MSVPEHVGAALVCSLCLDAVDVLCVGRAALSPEEQRRLAARARARGRRIITERPWPGSPAPSPRACGRRYEMRRIALWVPDWPVNPLAAGLEALLRHAGVAAE